MHEIINNTRLAIEVVLHCREALVYSQAILALHSDLPLYPDPYSKTIFKDSQTQSFMNTVIIWCICEEVRNVYRKGLGTSVQYFLTLERLDWRRESVEFGVLMFKLKVEITFGS